MSSIINRTLLVTHHDLDGFGCRVIAESLYNSLGLDLDTIHVNYDFENDPSTVSVIMNYRSVIFTDISFSDVFAKKLDNVRHVLGTKYYLFDHHKSSYDRLTPLNYDWITIDESKCGTKLIYEFAMKLNPSVMSEYSEFVTLVNDYDLWIHQYEDSKLLQFLWSSSDKSQFVSRFVNNPKVVLSLEEAEVVNKSLSDYNNSYESSMNSLQVYTDCNGLKFGLCNLGLLYSLVADKILTENPELDYLALLNKDTNKVSFRSKKTAVEPIAKALGGGGHPLAASTTLPPLSDIVASIQSRCIVKLDFLGKFSGGAE